MRLDCRTSCRAEKSAGDRAKRFGSSIDSNGFDGRNDLSHFAGAAVEFAWLVSENQGRVVVGAGVGAGWT